ncbi:MAG: hypothetical protein KDA44_22570 [Planctomycetales bacterium]|nr:hypothetical protein [Planctomycetales bacterium]
MKKSWPRNVRENQQQCSGDLLLAVIARRLTDEANRNTIAASRKKQRHDARPTGAAVSVCEGCNAAVAVIACVRFAVRRRLLCSNMLLSQPANGAVCR